MFKRATTMECQPRSNNGQPQKIVTRVANINCIQDDRKGGTFITIVEKTSHPVRITEQSMDIEQLAKAYNDNVTLKPVSQ